MAEHDLEKLLGGFSADTLTADERQRLYEAALRDQQLFNALADEQALKELLTDPAVRNKLLQVLNRQGTHRSRSWLDRMMRPSALAWAGGMAAGLFAIVLGVRVYEDSVRQASETAALEEGRPPLPAAAPPVQAPQAEVQTTEPRKAAPPPGPAKNAPSNRRTKAREPRGLAAPDDDLVRSAEPENAGARSNEETRGKSDATPQALTKSAAEPATSHERPAPPTSPAAGVRRYSQAEAGAPASGTSARALFDADGTGSEQIGSTLQEKDAEPVPTPERFAMTRKALDRTVPAKPLALRYRIIDKGQEGSDRAADHRRVIRFTVESNQDGYIQIWRSSGESLPELVLPTKETGRISLKTAAGERQEITVGGDTDRLIVRLSRVPFGPITRQEAVMAGRGGHGQIVESVLGTEEPATYIANPDPSAGELAADIPLTRTR